MTEMNQELGENTPDSELDSEPTHLIPKIDFAPHTVFILCGPTGAGKSRFAEDLSILAEANRLTIKVISSDKIRRELLSESALGNYSGKSNAYSKQMLSVSPQAFRILETEFKAAISFPVSTEIVVVDTTGMNGPFQEFISSEGRKNGYKVVLVTFEYKNRSDYVSPTNTAAEKEIIQRSVIKFRRDVLPTIKREHFDGRLRIKSRLSFGWDLVREDSWWFEDSIETWVDNAVTESAKERTNTLRGCLVAGLGSTDKTPQEYAVIGDSHECVEELQTLIDKIEERAGDQIIAHVGDYLDKGQNTEAMVNFMYGRFKAGDVILVANHESYLYKRLHGQVDPNPSLEEEHFKALPILENNADLAAKFFEIFENSLPFAILLGNHWEDSPPVFVTHAPCHSTMLGKVHDLALLQQRNYRTRDRSKPLVEELKWVFEDAEVIHPVHIFGHVAHSIDGVSGRTHQKLVYKNKVFLDTGAVYGGHLTAVIIKSGEVVDSISIPSKRRAEGDLPTGVAKGPVKERPFVPEDYDLSSRDLRLLSVIEERGVRYISGTMAPAPSSNDEIEPLRAGLDWMKANGAETVVLQPKYMGSRCQFYLFENAPEKTFATSRSGWPIRGIEGLSDEEFQVFLVSVWESRRDLIEKYGDVILDGELMPWSALGEELIEKAFLSYQKLIDVELKTLASDLGLAQLTEFAASFDVFGRQTDLSKFKRVLTRFSKRSAPEFKAFKVLSHNKGSSDLPAILDDLNGFNILSGTSPAVVDLCKEGGYDYELAEKYFNALTQEPESGGSGLEGVVIKPLRGDCKIPYLKVRSKEYLRLVYGYDYTRPERHARLCRQKNITGKIRLSITESNLANQMLSATGEDKKKLAIRMIGEMKKEQELDPRL